MTPTKYIIILFMDTEDDAPSIERIVPLEGTWQRHQAQWQLQQFFPSAISGDTQKVTSAYTRWGYVCDVQSDGVLTEPLVIHPPIQKAQP